MDASTLIPDISGAKEKWPLDATDGGLEATSDLTPAVGIPGTGSDAVLSSSTLQNGENQKASSS